MNIGYEFTYKNMTYKIIGKVKRSFLLECNGKYYKATSAKINKMIELESIKYPCIERRVQYQRFFNKDAKIPETEAEVMKWISQLECELSPENLYCDGEISKSKARSKYKEIMETKKELEQILGRPIYL